MASGEATILIHRSAGQALDFVMDLQRYRIVDRKIGAIRSLRRDGNTVTFRFRPRLLGLPGPLTTQQVVRSGDERIDIQGLPSWTDRLTRFETSFTCVQHPEGILVTRRLDFAPNRLVAPILDPLLSHWLRREVPRKLAAAKTYLEKND